MRRDMTIAAIIGPIHDRLNVSWSAGGGADNFDYSDHPSLPNRQL